MNDSRHIVFLIGSGASVGASTRITPEQPPLGPGLFDALARYSPGDWGPESRLGKVYGDKLRDNFERTMFEEVCLWEPSLSILEWYRSMALFFARFTLPQGGADLYSRLLTHLRNSELLEHCVIGSLNYEYLLEQAAQRLEIELCYSTRPSNPNTLSVLKVHGSCNLITEDLSHFRVYLTNPNSSLEVGTKFVSPVDLPGTLRTMFSEPGAYHFAVMSLYAAYKNSILSPGQIQQTRNEWDQVARDAHMVIVIGVRPNEDDKHIWDPIRESTAHGLYLIGGEIEGWRRARSDFQLLGQTFEAGFEPLCLVLRAPRSLRVVVTPFK